MVFLLLFTGALYLTFLGHSPLAMSEGHRAIPAWEMMESGDWLVPTLFGQPYLRKPPGIQWFIAAASAIFGSTEFAARSVSALSVVAGAGLSWFFARRWFGDSNYGRGCARAAGYLFALAPLFWYPGRSAEIEALHNTCALVSLLLTIDLFLGPAGAARSRWFAAGGLAIALVLTGIVKGPAAIPCILAALVASVVVTRRWRTLRNLPFWTAVLVAALTLGGFALAIRARAASLDLAPVTQSPAGFLWDLNKWTAIVLLPLSSLASALPGSLLLPWSLRRTPVAPTQARTPATVPPKAPSTTDIHAPLIAKTLTLTVLLALVIYTILGVSNNRYAMPALTLVPIAASYAFRGFAEARAVHNARWVRLGRRALLHRAAIPAFGLTIATIVHHAWLESRRDRISGYRTGEALANALPENATLIANQMIEYRPETFLYAQRWAMREGSALTIRWIPPHVSPPDRPYFAALRQFPDPAVKTSEFEVAAAADPDRHTVFRSLVHRFEIEVVVLD